MKEKIDGADVASTTERGLNMNNICVDATKKTIPMAKYKNAWYIKVEDLNPLAPQLVPTKNLTSKRRLIQ